MPIELPYTCQNSLNYVSPLLLKHIKVASNMREIGKDFRDVHGLRLCDKIQSLAYYTQSLS